MNDENTRMGQHAVLAKISAGFYRALSGAVGLSGFAKSLRHATLKALGRECGGSANAGSKRAYLRRLRSDHFNLARERAPGRVTGPPAPFFMMNLACLILLVLFTLWIVKTA